MTSNADILVTCTNGACSIRKRTPLLDLETFILIHTDAAIPSFEDAKAGQMAVACPSCARAGRTGTLVYVSDHLRKAPPDQETAVPAAYDPTTSVWKYAKMLYTAARPEHPPAAVELRVPTGHRLEVRPYGGHVLQYGNTDKASKYGELLAPPSDAPKDGRYVHELKHDLLYLAYYGNRERSFDDEPAGVGLFSTMTVGAMLALKFDLSFFYGVPTTTDIEQSTVSDAELRGLQLDTFSKPIFFDPKIQDNPLRPIIKGLVYPLGKLTEVFPRAHEMLGAAIEQLRQAKAPGLKPAHAKRLAKKATSELNRAVKALPESAPALDLASLKKWPGIRKDRPLSELLGHESFAASKRKSWTYFEACLRRCYGLEQTTVVSHASALEEFAKDTDEKLAKAAQRALERYKPLHVAMATVDVGELRRILGGMPETFEPYRAEMHKYAVVDHATAFYIKSILAGIKIGSNAGKVTAQPGRKLVFRMPEGGLKGEPADRKAYAEMVITACKKGTRFDVPPMIMLERQKNESGFRASERVGGLALAKEETQVVLPIMGIDWRNWGYLDNGEKASNFAYSEIFTNSVGVKQEHPGYHGPIVLSRGVGGGQVTLGTRLLGVSPKGVEKTGYGYQWVSGIPVPVDGRMPTPGNWTGAKGSIEMARDLLKKKFTDGSLQRNCTYDQAKEKGKRFDCASCLKRFSLVKKPDLRLCKGDDAPSYYCSVDASKWKDLFGEELAEDTEQARTEFPCSWLRAVQKYAGASARGYERILKASREIVAVGAQIDANAADDDDDDDELETSGGEEDDDGGAAQRPGDDDDDAEEPAKKPPKKPAPKQKDPKKKSKDSAGAALRAAIEEVRKQL